MCAEPPCSAGVHTQVAPRRRVEPSQVHNGSPLRVDMGCHGCAQWLRHGVPQEELNALHQLHARLGVHRLRGWTQQAMWEQERHPAMEGLLRVPLSQRQARPSSRGLRVHARRARESPWETQVLYVLPAGCNRTQVPDARRG